MVTGVHLVLQLTPEHWSIVSAVFPSGPYSVLFMRLVTCALHCIAFPRILTQPAGLPW